MANEGAGSVGVNSDSSALSSPAARLFIIVGQLSDDSRAKFLLMRLVEDLAFSWNVELSQCDLDEELKGFVNVNPVRKMTVTGEETWVYQSSALHMEVLRDVGINTVHDKLTALSSDSNGSPFTLVVYAGMILPPVGLWLLQDGTYRPNICSGSGEELCPTVFEISGSLAAGSTLATEHKGVDAFCKQLLETVYVPPLCFKDINLPALSFPHYCDRPTMYIFPSGQGSSAFFEVGDFSFVADTGYGYSPHCWDFIRLRERLDVLLLTHLGIHNLFGTKSMLEKMKMLDESLRPKIGLMLLNCHKQFEAVMARKQDLIVVEGGKNISKTRNQTMLNWRKEAMSIVQDLQQLKINSQPCTSEARATHLYLYHKIGLGNVCLDVLWPTNDEELKHFLKTWEDKSNDVDLMDRIPLWDMFSVCAMLHWIPSPPGKPIQILFTGGAPENVVFAGLEKLKRRVKPKNPFGSFTCLCKDTYQEPGAEHKVDKTVKKVEDLKQGNNSCRIQSKEIQFVSRELAPKRKGSAKGGMVANNLQDVEAKQHTKAASGVCGGRSGEAKTYARAKVHIGVKTELSLAKAPDAKVKASVRQMAEYDEVAKYTDGKRITKVQKDNEAERVHRYAKQPIVENDSYRNMKQASAAQIATQESSGQATDSSSVSAREIKEDISKSSNVCTREETKEDISKSRDVCTTEETKEDVSKSSNVYASDETKEDISKSRDVCTAEETKEDVSKSSNVYASDETKEDIRKSTDVCTTEETKDVSKSRDVCTTEETKEDIRMSSNLYAREETKEDISKSRDVCTTEETKEDVSKSRDVCAREETKEDISKSRDVCAREETKEDVSKSSDVCTTEETKEDIRMSSDLCAREETKEDISKSRDVCTTEETKEDVSKSSDVYASEETKEDRKSSDVCASEEIKEDIRKSSDVCASEEIKEDIRKSSNVFASEEIKEFIRKSSDVCASEEMKEDIRKSSDVCASEETNEEIRKSSDVCASEEIKEDIRTSSNVCASEETNEEISKYVDAVKGEERIEDICNSSKQSRKENSKSIDVTEGIEKTKVTELIFSSVDCSLCLTPLKDQHSKMEEKIRQLQQEAPKRSKECEGISEMAKEAAGMEPEKCHEQIKELQPENIVALSSAPKEAEVVLRQKETGKLAAEMDAVVLFEKEASEPSEKDSAELTGPEDFGVTPVEDCRTSPSEAPATREDLGLPPAEEGVALPPEEKVTVTEEKQVTPSTDEKRIMPSEKSAQAEKLLITSTGADELDRADSLDDLPSVSKTDKPASVKQSRETVHSFSSIAAGHAPDFDIEILRGGRNDFPAMNPFQGMTHEEDVCVASMSLADEGERLVDIKRKANLTPDVERDSLDDDGECFDPGQTWETMNLPEPEPPKNMKGAKDDNGSREQAQKTKGRSNRKPCSDDIERTHCTKPAKETRTGYGQRKRFVADKVAVHKSMKAEVGPSELLTTVPESKNAEPKTFMCRSMPTDEAAVYVTVAFIPGRGDPLYVSKLFFQKVRARYYVLSSVGHDPSVLNSLLEAKEMWGQDRKFPVSVIPTHGSKMLDEWVASHTEKLSSLNVDLRKPADECKVYNVGHENDDNYAFHAFQLDLYETSSRT